MFHNQPHKIYELGDRIKYFHHVFIDNQKGNEIRYTPGKISNVLGNDIYEVDLEYPIQMLFGEKQKGIATWYKELQPLEK